MKVKNTTDTFINLRGYDFPVGEPVDVDDDTAKKCLDTGHFEMVTRKAKRNAKNKT